MKIAKPAPAKARARAISEVKSPDYMDVVVRFLTRSLCDEVFVSTRGAERQRKWTLFALVWFWLGLLQGEFASQTRGLLEARAGHPLLPKVDASPESFFMKIQSVRPTFFRNVFAAFTKGAMAEMKPSFASELGVDVEAFPEIYAVDGSRLEKVGRLLKATRATSKAILPGSMEAVYDVRRGCVRDLWFDPNGCASELLMFENVVGSIAKGALLLADRYYAKPVVWGDLNARGIWMVSRHNKTVKKSKVQALSKKRGKICVDDWIVEMGSADPVTLRWVHLWGDGFDLRLVTNVLDPSVLTPAQLMALYRKRWSVERMYLAMKDVLDLNGLYNCSPAAVGQQVYATAILYNALRLAQSQIADKARMLPDELSEKKLFPRLIGNFVKATFMLAGAEIQIERLIAAGGKDDGKMPPISINHFDLRITVRDCRVEKRSDVRRKRRYCEGRSRYTAFGKIPGTKKYTMI